VRVLGPWKDSAYLVGGLMAKMPRPRARSLRAQAPGPVERRRTGLEAADQRRLHRGGAAYHGLSAYRAVRGAGFILALTDEDRIVLDSFGDAEILARAKENNYVPGCCRAKDVVGTNAIALAMVERRPVQLTGPEHYNVRHHSWTCASSPVFSPSGTFLGTVTVSGDSTDAHRHTGHPGGGSHPAPPA
jgi:transcriptional regulator of acetoin/glycerol metabolism